MTDSPAHGRRGHINPRDASSVRVQKPVGLPAMFKDWTPDERRLDSQNTRIGPRCTKTGPPRNKTTRPSIPETMTKDFVGFRTSQDVGLHGIWDFVGFKTLRDPGLCGIQDFAGLRTSWDLGLCRQQELYTPRIRILFCGVLFENTNFPDKFKTWTPLGIRSVVSVIHCVLFRWLLGARPLPTEPYRAR